MQFDADRDKLLTALDAIWRRENEGVRQFGLTYDPSGVRPAYGGWIVPVASGVEGGSAYDLTRLLDRLSELTEAQTSLSVNVLLDPARIGLPNTNGTNGPHGSKR